MSELIQDTPESWWTWLLHDKDWIGCHVDGTRILCITSISCKLGRKCRKDTSLLQCSWYIHSPLSSWLAAHDTRQSSVFSNSLVMLYKHIFACIQHWVLLKLKNATYTVKHAKFTTWYFFKLKVPGICARCNFHVLTIYTFRWSC